MDSRLVECVYRATWARSGLTGNFDTLDGFRLRQGGREYIDFHSGAGALNYGHRHPALMARLDQSIAHHGLPDGELPRQMLVHQLFETIEQVLLRPRSWAMRMQLVGPGSACALEIALQHARRVTGRNGVMVFTSRLPGLGEGKAGEQAMQRLRKMADHTSFASVCFMPFDQSLGPDVDTMAHIEQNLQQRQRQGCLPAAMVVETILGHSGVNVLSWRWLRELAALCRRYDVVFVIDESRVGCGRSGHFFSFEAADIQADIVVLSRALSGVGLPLSVLLSDPALALPRCDHVAPAWLHSPEASLALLGACHALPLFWADGQLASEVQRKEALLRNWLENMVHSYPGHGLGVRGRGLIQGLVVPGSPLQASRLAAHALEKGLLVHAAGEHDEVLKIMPALCIPDNLLIRGLEILELSLAQVLGGRL